MKITKLHNRLQTLIPTPVVILSNQPVRVNGKPYDGSALQGQWVIDVKGYYSLVPIDKIDGGNTLPLLTSTKQDTNGVRKAYHPCCGGGNDSKYHWNAPKPWTSAWKQYVTQKTKPPKREMDDQKQTFTELLAKAHIRCIHMPDRTDREMIMQEAFRRLGIADRQNLFFNAIDGTKQNHKPNMRPGNWGCALSKAAIMKEAADQEKPLLLLEDDVVISPQIHQIMDACLAELPDDWKVLYMGCVALEPHKTMPTKGMPKREKKGKWYEVLANANLNHALIIRDTHCLSELSKILADPNTYNKDEGRFTSDYTVAQYFAHKDIPMYGVVPTVAKQCTTYSDNENKVVHRKAAFDTIPKSDFKLKTVEIPQLEINIAKGCNFRCNYCGHFSTYRKGLVPLQEIIDSIITWAQKVSPKVFILGGGEPFLNDHLATLLYESRTRLGNKTTLRLFSNGVLIPSIQQQTIKALKETNTEIVISDHAETSQNIPRVLAFLREHGIPCRVHDSSTHWKKSYQIDENGNPIPFKSSPKLSWKNCPARCCHTLANGKLFKCSRLANVYQSANEGAIDATLWKDALTYTPLLPSASPDEIANHLNTNEIPQCSMCPDRTYHITPLQLP